MEKKHPSRPEQQREDSFAEGVDRKPDTPEEESPPDFGRGLRERSEAEAERKRRFSEGVEQRPETPDKTTERRFSEGVERNPTSE